MEQCLRMEIRSEHMLLKVYGSRVLGDEEFPYPRRSGEMMPKPRLEK